MATFEPGAVLKEFQDNNFKLEDAAVGDACADMAQSFGLNPQELVESWEVFYLNMKVKTNNTVTKGALENFRKHLERDRVEAFKKKQPAVHFYTKDDLEDVDMDQPSTPWKSNVKPTTDLSPGPAGRSSGIPTTTKKPIARDPGSPVTPLFPAPATPSKTLFQATPASAFKQRTNSGAVQLVFDQPLEGENASGMEIDGEASEQSFQIEAARSWPSENYRYMYDRIEDKANALEKRLLAFGAALAVAEDCSTSHQVYAASQDTVTVVGRICCDTEGGRINEHSVLLEGSQEHSNGERVKLDLRNVPHFSIFPGQTVGVEGQNPSGHCLVASRLVDALPPSPASAIAVTDANGKTSARPPSMMIAAGPFTAADNLAYEPLDELLSVAKARRPDVLLLMGPFVDREHPHVRQGTVDAHVEDVYAEQVQKKVEAFCEEVGARINVVVVPSVRDSHHDAIFPQPPFPLDWKDPGKEITFLSNPGVFTANGVRVAVTTMDVLKHLSSEEAARVAPGAPSDRMARLAGHILGQRSFYPLFPPALGTPLDLSLAPSALELTSLPDVLVLPSDLAPFVKVLAAELKEGGQSKQPAQVICVNPGRLSKGTSGGTFSYIQSKASGGVAGKANPAKVEIIRI